MGVNDPSGYKAKYDRARQRLEHDDIDEEDRRAIRAFIDEKENSDEHKYSSLEHYTTILLRAASLTHKPLTEWQDKDPENGRYQSDYQQFMQGLADGSLPEAKDDGYSDEYRRSFRQNLKPFFRFLNREWASDIDIGRPSQGTITEDDCFSSDETARMFQVADERDSAVIALWLATGQRASAMASLKLDDVEFTQNRGRFRLNPDAIGLKGAEGWRPMLWATPYVKRWVNKHPAREQDDPPLFCCKRNGAHYSIGDPLSYDGIKRICETVCTQAGIDEGKAHTHRFRHTAIRRMIRDGLSEQRIKFMVGWHEDSTQLSRYGSLTDKTHSADIEDHYDMGADENTDDDMGIEHENCPKCSTPLSTLVRPSYCPDCGLPLSHSAQETEDMIEEGTSTGIEAAEDADEALSADTFRQIAKENPEAAVEMIQDIEDEL